MNAYEAGHREPVDEQALEELDLYANNTAELYPQKQAILRNIERRIKNGSYDPSLAPKVWLYWVDQSAKMYADEFAERREWSRIFSPATREALAKRLARREYNELMLQRELRPGQTERVRAVFGEPAGREHGRPWPRPVAREDAGPNGALDWKQSGDTWVAATFGGATYKLVPEADDRWHTWYQSGGHKEDLGVHGNLGAAMGAARRHQPRMSKAAEGPYVRKTEDEYVLQGRYGHGWEDLTAETTRKEIKQRLREYQENEGGEYRIVHRRVRKATRSARPAASEARKPSSTPLVRITFDKVTPGKDEGDDPETESGWIDEEGISMVPEGSDETVVSKTVKFLQREGVIEASSTHFHRGVWYSTEYAVADYGTGEEEQRSYHLDGFTLEQEQEIWNEMGLGWDRRRGREASEDDQIYTHKGIGYELQKRFQGGRPGWVYVVHFDKGRRTSHIHYDTKAEARSAAKSVIDDGWASGEVREAGGKKIKYVKNDVNGWIEMPVNYDPHQIRRDDVVNDSQLRLLDYTEAEKRGLYEGGAGERVPVIHEQKPEIVGASVTTTETATVVTAQEDFSTVSQAEQHAYTVGARFIAPFGKRKYYVFTPRKSGGYDKRLMFHKAGKWHISADKVIAQRLSRDSRAIRVSQTAKTIVREEARGRERLVVRLMNEAEARSLRNRLDATTKGYSDRMGSSVWTNASRDEIEAALSHLGYAGTATIEKDTGGKADERRRGRAREQTHTFKKGDEVRWSDAMLAKGKDIDPRWYETQKDARGVVDHVQRDGDVLVYWNGDTETNVHPPTRLTLVKPAPEGHVYTGPRPRAREHGDRGTLYDQIKVRDRVTIVDRFGKEHTGRAVMLGPAGWVLNMGGKHGTPAIASPENVTRVAKAKAVEGKPKSRASEASSHKLDTFCLAYVEAALWSSTDESRPDGGDPLDKNYSIKDIDSETLDAMRQDCADFQEQNEKLLAEAYDHEKYDASYAGHDLWLSRNGHGAGYFDRNLGDVGERLQDAARALGNFDLYVGDDGKIHGSPLRKHGREASEAPKKTKEAKGDDDPSCESTDGACVAIIERAPGCVPTGIPMETPKDVYDFLAPRYAKLGSEHFFVLLVSNQGELLGAPIEIARGQADRVAVDIEQIVAAAITGAAAGARGFIVSHCHPSGGEYARPSSADKRLTQDIRDSARIACPSTAFIDHVVIAPPSSKGVGTYYSFEDKKVVKVSAPN